MLVNYWFIFILVILRKNSVKGDDEMGGSAEYQQGSYEDNDPDEAPYKPKSNNGNGSRFIANANESEDSSDNNHSDNHSETSYNNDQSNDHRPYDEYLTDQSKDQHDTPLL